MKNLVCPVSNEKIQENLPRVMAFFVVGLLLTYLVTGYIAPVIYLIFDFFMRGANQSKYSLIYRIAKPIADNLPEPAAFIDKAPKLFAARLGGAMAVLITFFHLVQLDILSSILALLVVVLASLECFFNLCTGCYIYSWFIVPFFKKSK